MGIKFAPYLQQNSANWTLNKVLFWYFGANVVHNIRPKYHYLKVQFLRHQNVK